jgi:penicillin amidase
MIDGAEVVIDEWGIPHIYGETVEDAFTALGYMHARDRLFQMVMQTYLAAGRISEVVGEMGVDTDKRHRTYGFAKSAEETYQWYLLHAATNEDVNYTIRAVHAHVNGVNAFINSMTSENTPIEFKILGYTPDQWEPVYSFIWAKYMTWGLSGGIRDLRNEFIRVQLDNDSMYNDLFPDVYPDTIPVIPEQFNLSLSDYPLAPGGYPASIVPPVPTAIEDEPTNLISTDKIAQILDTTSDLVDLFGDRAILGSNSWAVNGSKTADGHAILSNDPHLGLQAPSLWYEVHIVVPGELNVQGGSLPGTPGILIGHTEHISWGMTNVGADVLDIFVEDLNPSNLHQYRYNGEWKDFEIVDEPIHVKGGATVAFNVSWSVHGPCIDSATSTYDFDNDESYPSLAMNWTGSGVTHEVMTLGILNRANNLTEYYDAMYWWDSPPHNFIYADDEGNIAITVAGRFPIRAGYSGNFPVQAVNDSVGMVSNVPYAFNPRSVNPSQCFLQSANQKSIDPASYPYTILGAQSPDYRGERIHTYLDSASDLTVEDMMQLQADILDLTAQKMLPYVLDAWTGGNSTIETLIGWLSAWDYQMDVDQPTPTIWTYLLDNMRYEVFDELRSVGLSATTAQVPVLEWVLTNNITYYLDDHTTEGVAETMDDILVRALHRTASDLYAISDDENDWVYGLHHIIRIDHLAGLTYIGGGEHRGSGYTLNVGSGPVVTHGPSRRMIVNYAPTPEYYTVYPGGQSQVMFSEHWDDLFDLWYGYDSNTKHYGYTQEYNYSTATSFEAADDGTMIEMILILLPRR